MGRTRSFFAIHCKKRRSLPSLVRRALGTRTSPGRPLRPNPAVTDRRAGQDKALALSDPLARVFPLDMRVFGPRGISAESGQRALMLARRIRKALRLAKPRSKWSMGRGRRPSPGVAEYELSGRYGTPQPGTARSSSVRSAAGFRSSVFRSRNPAPTTGNHQKYGIRPRM